MLANRSRRETSFVLCFGFMQARKVAIAAVAGALVAVLVILLSVGEPQTPEELVRSIVSDMAQAATDKNPAGLLEHVSEDFSGQGGLDRDRLRGLLFVELRRGAWTRVVLYDTDVVQQSQGVIDVRTRAFLARGDGPLPSNADGWELDMTFEEESDGTWRVVRGGYRSVRRGR